MDDEDGGSNQRSMTLLNKQYLINTRHWIILFLM
jgi:hypothetical protein